MNDKSKWVATSAPTMRCNRRARAVRADSAAAHVDVQSRTNGSIVPVGTWFRVLDAPLPLFVKRVGRVRGVRGDLTDSVRALTDLARRLQDLAARQARLKR